MLRVLDRLRDREPPESGSRAKQCVACGRNTTRYILFGPDGDREQVRFNEGKRYVVRSGRTNYAWVPAGKGEAAYGSAEPGGQYAVVPLHPRCEREHFEALLKR